MESKKVKHKNNSQYSKYISQVDPALLVKWKKARSIKTKIDEKDPVNLKLNSISKIGGLDISISKYDSTTAVVSLVVLDYNTQQVVYEKSEFVKVIQPYVPGFLAFREVEHLKQIVENFKLNEPNLLPEVYLIDGNGIFHSNRFGLACHLGVLCDISTIGCGKTVFSVDGLTVNRVKSLCEDNFKNKGDCTILKGRSAEIFVAAIKSTGSSKDPIIVSQGHKICLKTAIEIVKKVTIYKVTEPIRVADKLSRKIIRQYDQYNFENMRKKTQILPRP